MLCKQAGIYDLVLLPVLGFLEQKTEKYIRFQHNLYNHRVERVCLGWGIQPLAQCRNPN